MNTFPPEPGARLERLIEDPISLEPFQNPVSLIPCAHKVGLVSAEKLFGKREENSWKIEPSKEKICPVCSKQVLGYTIDHTLKNIAKILSQLDLSKISLCIPYPGKPAKLAHSIGTWELMKTKTTNGATKLLGFASNTENSGISSIKFMKNKSEVFLVVEVKESLYAKFKTYFAHFEIYPSESDKIFHTFSSTAEKTFFTLYELIRKNNSLPETHKELIEKIVKEGAPNYK